MSAALALVLGFGVLSPVVEAAPPNMTGVWTNPAAGSAWPGWQLQASADLQTLTGSYHGIPPFGDVVGTINTRLDPSQTSYSGTLRASGGPNPDEFGPLTLRIVSANEMVATWSPTNGGGSSWTLKRQGPAPAEQPATATPAPASPTAQPSTPTPPPAAGQSASPDALTQALQGLPLGVSPAEAELIRGRVRPDRILPIVQRQIEHDFPGLDPKRNATDQRVYNVLVLGLGLSYGNLFFGPEDQYRSEFVGVQAITRIPIGGPTHRSSFSILERLAQSGRTDPAALNAAELLLNLTLKQDLNALPAAPNA